MKPNWNDWAWMVSISTRAMVGKISLNIREVHLSYGNSWLITIILKQESEEDVKVFQDVVEDIKKSMKDNIDYFSLEAYCSVSLLVEINTGQINIEGTPEYRIIFGRREPDKE